MAYRFHRLTAICLLIALNIMTCSDLVYGQTNEKTSSQNPCTGKTMCNECIQTSNCAWCLDPNFGDTPRCFNPDLTMDIACPEEYIMNLLFEQKIYMNRSLTLASKSSGVVGGASGGASMSGSAGMGASGGSSFGMSGGSFSGASDRREIVQISPQHVSLKLRINQKHHLQIKYSQAEDYPVDLYYLMDLSNSMSDDKEKLSNLGDTLSDEMRKITSNFRLGFGSFVDKVLMPYVSTVPENLREPCTGCAAPYGFKNAMALSMNTSRFSDEVRNAAVSGNLDAPEGGFDAIMQAIVCRKQIGWREKARRLLLFSTDAGFHYAGDGKLGGVITPNDGKCHLDRDGYYTHSLTQDYPSISQINMKVQQNAINIIFAVTYEQQHVYKNLASHIEGSSSALLSNDSSNIVQLVKDEYAKISSAVEMKDNATSAVKVTYYSSCLGKGTPVQTNKCDGLKVGDVITFSAEIVVTSCPKNPQEWFQKFQIYPIGINESLIVDLEMLCSCPCEQPGHPFYQERSKICNFEGNYKCGICDCYDNFFGRKCECNAADVKLQNEIDRGCHQDNFTSVDCNGRGNCVCGVCECEQRENPEEKISGKYCECDNFSCDRHGGLVCSGPERGTCECGTCVCLEGWSGSACNCKTTNDSCIPPKGGDVCSDHGECVCGTCRCNVKDGVRYSGKYCEKCPNCSGRCHEFSDCVQCQVHKTGPLMKDNFCATNCTAFTPYPSETLIVDDSKEEYLCTFYDDDKCRFQFIYSEENDKIAIRAKEERECPEKVFMLGIVLGVIAAIVLIGLAILLLWKLLTTIHDRREFARFEKERMSAKWDTGENPIYRQATSTFKNPTYAGK